ncbi:hypothetical protein EDB83DRAFT_2419429, partial [Lactarius deliciosus]
MSKMHHLHCSTTSVLSGVELFSKLGTTTIGGCSRVRDKALCSESIQPYHKTRLRPRQHLHPHLSLPPCKPTNRTCGEEIERAEGRLVGRSSGDKPKNRIDVSDLASCGYAEVGILGFRTCTTHPQLLRDVAKADAAAMSDIGGSVEYQVRLGVAGYISGS